MAEAVIDEYERTHPAARRQRDVRTAEAWGDGVGITGVSRPKRTTATADLPREEALVERVVKAALGKRVAQDVARAGTGEQAGAPPERTPDEQAVIDLVARREDREWAEKHAHLILEQARAIGTL